MADTDGKIAPLGETDAWKRDLLVRLMGWAAGAALLVAGWLISADGTEFSLSGGGAPYHRALGLLLISGYGWLFWGIVVRGLWRGLPRHPAVPSRRIMIGYSLGLIVPYALMLGLVLD